MKLSRDLEPVIRKKLNFENENNSANFEVLERKTGKYRFVTLDYIEKLKNADKSKNNWN